MNPLEENDADQKQPQSTEAQVRTVRFDPIHSSAQMAELIGSVTGQPLKQVLAQLRKEFIDPGVTVATDFASRGVQPYVMSDGMMRFYTETDAFLFELALWNRNTNKRLMCSQIISEIHRHFGRTVDVLSIGDGMGFDCLELYRAGHRVTYFELPGKSEACARRIFDAQQARIPVLTNPEHLANVSCDVVVCLDTLEHVPDPSQMVGEMAGYLRAGGLLFVHAPFYMLHPRYPTHLHSNRRFSGSIALFTQHHLKPLSANLFWNPIALVKTDPAAAIPNATAGKRFTIRAGSLILSLGRFGLLPLWLIHAIRRRGNRWFDKSGKPVR